LTVFAYDPPVDTAGPLQVRIYEPTLGSYGAGGRVPLDRVGVSFSVAVALENSAETEIRGSLRLSVIDNWKVNPPDRVSFAVPPRGREQFRFQVTIGEGTFNADYPVHAHAEFQYLGRQLVAHPILLLATSLSNPPRAELPVEWNPVPVPATGGMGLWRLPIRREAAVVERRNLSASRTGAETAENAGLIQYGVQVARGTTREAVCMTIGPRPPAFNEQCRLVRVEYPLHFAGPRPVKLRFGLSGTARCRVRAIPFGGSIEEGTILFERTVALEKWEDFEVSLDSLAGRRIRLQLEAEGDPEVSEQVYFAEPSIITGSPLQPLAFPPAMGREARSLGTIEQSGYSYEVRLWPGRRGLLDSAVGFINRESRLFFNGFQVEVLGDDLDDWRSAQELVSIAEESVGGRYRVRHSFRGWAGNFDLLGEMWVAEDVLLGRFWLENTPAPRPWLAVYLERVSLGPWSEKVNRVYAGVGNVIEEPSSFVMGFGGHRLASSFVGFDFANGFSLLQAVDTPPDHLEVDPDLKIYTLSTPHSQTLSIIPSVSAWQAAIAWREVAGLRPAGGVVNLAGRFVFDLWAFDLGYSAGAGGLQHSFKYGLTDAVVVWHNWQRWGYDYRLPDIFPPSPSGGTEAEFAQLVAVCRENGVLFAPHDNYIDFYPDAEGFSFDKIAFQVDGSPRKAWYRSSLLAQSYRFRPDCVRPFLERNLRLIKKAFHPNAYFIDVWSSMGPYDFWTSEGAFFDRTVTRKEWRNSFAWIRDFLGGDAPQISEAGHDQLIGWLDGAQANHLRIAQPPAEGFVIAAGHSDTARIPWLDAVVHDVFVLHGAGYSDRYAGGLDSRLHGIYSDDYITTEVLTGHPAMVSMPFGRDVVRKYWLLHGMMRGLALCRIDDVEFVGGSLHHQHVRWNNGAEVWVNRGPGEWQVEGHILPQYGFYGRVPVTDGTIEAAIEVLEGVIVEWSQTPEQVYANARPIVLDESFRSSLRSDGPDPRPMRMNPEGRLITFESVLTNGGARLTPEGNGLKIIPLPESTYFKLLIDWSDLPWKLEPARQLEAVDEEDRVLWSLPAQEQEDRILLNCEPGVFGYRLR